ncbi:hypothetical protein DICVIV_02559 [Dictyocaulus viviparus]|uniref:Uncharacterized protein n=1 Tax=Dictyocaulus viviparus TaxID=29172 RepID=A0A0D8Y3K4_DICVI|nr:hypothetical protein DICVIV_02559 [Dictyocaulus viviparus]
MTFTHSHVSGKIGIIQRYNFSYEFSRLQLPSSKMDLVQYIPLTFSEPQNCFLPLSIFSVQNSMDRCFSSSLGFEITAAEYDEYSSRLSKLPIVKHGTFDKKSRLELLSNCCDDFMESVNVNCGRVPSSTLTKRLLDHFSNGDIVKKRRKRKYLYTDELINKQQFQLYDKLISDLNHLLSI